jgi:hypothetical protein
VQGLVIDPRGLLDDLDAADPLTVEEAAQHFHRALSERP